MSWQELSADILNGFWQEQPTLPPRWFYDETGSRLFDEITQLPQYYPTRTERDILRERAGELAQLPVSDLIELGAGTSIKTRVLLDALTAHGRPLRFHPLDISPEVLLESADALRTQYPHLSVEPKIADFHDDLVPLAGQPGQRLLLFLGGTIGNLTEDERAHFLDRIRCALSPGDHFLLGADLVKDPARLIAAYDDPAGVTAAFNRNALKVIATTLDTRGLDPNDFAHEARWDPHRSRIEMHLRATRDVTVHFPSLHRTWWRTTGQSLRTEISRKFDPNLLTREVARHGFTTTATWTDPAQDYSLTLHRAATWPTGPANCLPGR